MSSINTLPTHLTAHCASFLDRNSLKKFACATKVSLAAVEYLRNVTLNLIKKHPYIRLLAERSDILLNANPRNYPQTIQIILRLLANSVRLDKEAEWIFEGVGRGRWWEAPKNPIEERTLAFAGRPALSPEALQQLSSYVDFPLDIFDTANKTNLRALYLLAQANSDERLLRAIPIESVGREGILKAFYQVVEADNWPAAKTFLSRVSPETLLNGIRLARTTNRYTMMKQLLQNTSRLNLDSLLVDAARTGDTEALLIIVNELKSERNKPHTLTHNFDPLAGFNEHNNNAVGLQEALIAAVLRNELENFQSLLQLQPSIQTLTHLRTYIGALNSYITARNANQAPEHNLVLRPFNSRELLRTPFLELINQVLPPEEEPVAAAEAQPEAVALIEAPGAVPVLEERQEFRVGAVIALMLALFVANLLISTN